MFMKAKFSTKQSLHGGYTLMAVLFYAAASFLILGAALDWCMTKAKLTDRKNKYYTTTAAAEAATEKVMASLGRDYAAQGEAMVFVNMANYRNLIPTTAENPEWARYSFSDGTGLPNQT